MTHPPLTRERTGFCVFIPRLPPTNTNHRRAHWSVQHKEAESWKVSIWIAMPITNRRDGPLDRARVTLTRCSSREPDYDNLVASFKPVVDALVKLRVIADDGPAVFDGGHPDYRWKKAPNKGGGVEIEVREA